MDVPDCHPPYSYLPAHSHLPAADPQYCACVMVTLTSVTTPRLACSGMQVVILQNNQVVAYADSALAAVNHAEIPD